MEIKINAIVLKAVDYKDNDRILTLYSLENGKITAGIKGVKKAGAKLKFASEPFCFAEYILNCKNGKYTVIGATYIDTFYELRLNLEKYYTSAIISDFLLNYTENEMPDTALFSLAINSIKDTAENPESAFIRKERQKRIIKAINSLKPKLKEVVIMYEIDGLSYEHIAYNLDCPIGTVKSRLFNAKQELAKKLQDLL